MTTTYRKLRRLAGATGLLVLICGLGTVPVEGKPPTNASPLLGTWVNITDTRGLAEVVITDVSGIFEVHAYGFCSPSLCDWGAHPAFRFSSSISSSTAIGFQTGFANSALQGHLIKTSTGQTLLEITTQTTFAPRDPRYDYQMTERFQLK